MKSFNTVIKLSVLIALLAAVAAGSGLLWQGSGESYPFTTLRGETVLIRGHGLYRYDTVASSSQEIGQDIVTLLVGIPLLVYAMLRARKDAMRGKLLLTGGLAYFLYTYASMSFLTAFNAFFLVYVALFSLSLFAFILALMALDPAEVAAHIGERFPRRAITAYFLVVAAFLALAWLGLVVPPMLTGTAPAGLESAITMVIQVLDLGVIVPTAILTALLLRKGNAWGYTLSLVVLLKILTMGAALISMITVQLLSGVAVDPVVTAGFGVISLSGIILAAMTLRTIRD
jgi:hypothetical protein